MLGATLASMAAAPAARGDCRLARVQLTPEDGLQMAVWVEDAQGNFVSTLYVTQTTGSYGLGNRPGLPVMMSGVAWPYGRRDHVLPVWAHRRGVTYPVVVFQDGRSEYLSHGLLQSSPEAYYCRPTTPSEIDIGTCPSPTTTGTDKGLLDPSQTSFYPPRNDLTSRFQLSGVYTDTADMMMFRDLNDLDAVSKATPAGGVAAELLGTLDPSIPDGDYVLWIEVSKEFDYNDTYNPTTYPPDPVLAQTQYGIPDVGQPSLVWQIPFTLDPVGGTFSTRDYVGYGDPLGADGTVSPPDSTINATATTYSYDEDGPGSLPPRQFPSLGQARLQLVADGGSSYRARLVVVVSNDAAPPGAPGPLRAVTVDAERASLEFVSPGDDGQTGMPTAYEVRYQAGEPLTDANFEQGVLLASPPPPDTAGHGVMFELPNLSPRTHYYVGVRAKDECLVPGPIAYTDFTTLDGAGGSVGWCFVATAAFGSPFDAHLAPLRALRDRVLRRQVMGELFVETYYTFGPAFAGLIEPSADLRALARAGLQPVVDFAEHQLER
jgi:hypothetical protein